MTRKSEFDASMLDISTTSYCQLFEFFLSVHRIKDQEVEINQLKAENELLRKQARLPSGVPQLPAKGMNVRAVSGRVQCSN